MSARIVPESPSDSGNEAEPQSDNDDIILEDLEDSVTPASSRRSSAEDTPRSEDDDMSVKADEIPDSDPDVHIKQRRLSEFALAMRRIAVLEAEYAQQGRDPRESAIECRRCLEPGVERKCCGNFYCNICFYQFDACPSCDAKIFGPSTKRDFDREPSDSQIFCGCLFKFMFLLIPVGLYVLFSMSDSRTVETVHGFQCAGLFAGCGEVMCSDYTRFLEQGAFELGEEDRCRNSSSRRGCVCSPSCVFDSCVNSFSQDEHGRDFCADRFDSGLILVDESFDVPMARVWEQYVNAASSRECGASSGSKALRFRGDIGPRFLESIDFNLEYGGKLSFGLRYGTGGTCSSMYTGLVTLSYSVDSGAVWRELMEFQVVDYKKNSFIPVNLVLPEDSWSPTTRFRWSQFEYTRHFDFWALDDILLKANLKPGWKDATTFTDLKKSRATSNTLARGCFNCDACRGDQGEGQCDPVAGYMEAARFAKGREYVFAVAGLCFLWRAMSFALRRAKRWRRAAVRRKKWVRRGQSLSPFLCSRKLGLIADDAPSYDRVDPITFTPRRGRRWQVVFLSWASCCVVGAVTIFVASRIDGMIRFDSMELDIFTFHVWFDLPRQWLFAVAAVMDLVAVVTIAVSVVGIGFRPKLRVYTYVNPLQGWEDLLKNNYLVLNGCDEEAIPLDRVRRVVLEYEPLLRRHCYAAMLSCIPVASLAAALCSETFLYSTLVFVGVREIFGISSVMSLWQAVFWGLSRSAEDKKEFDASVPSGRTMQVAWWYSLFGFFLFALFYCSSQLLPIFNTEMVSKHLIPISIGVIGTLFFLGFFTGAFRYLPVSGWFFPTDSGGRVIIMKYLTGTSPTPWGKFLFKHGWARFSVYADGVYETLFTQTSWVLAPLDQNRVKEFREQMLMLTLMNRYNYDLESAGQGTAKAAADGFDLEVEEEPVQEEEKKRPPADAERQGKGRATRRLSAVGGEGKQLMAWQIERNAMQSQTMARRSKIEVQDREIQEKLRAKAGK